MHRREVPKFAGRAALLLMLGGARAVMAQPMGCVLPPFPPQSNGQPACYPLTSCDVGGGCVALPTSLQPVDTVANVSSDNGWIPGNTPCGTQRCKLIFICCCGPRLSGSVCA